MRIFRRPDPRIAQIDVGFWCAEAAALQRAITQALGRVGDRDEVGAQLEFSAGTEGRVVVAWRRRIVGFVPADPADRLRPQLRAAAPAVLMAEGRVVHRDGLWRVWVGPPPDDALPPEYPPDELAPPPVTLLGFPWRGRAPGSA